MMDDLCIASYNVDGLKDPKKRRQIFDFISKKPYDIILLQETHVQQCDIMQWQAEWHSYSLWNPGLTGKTCGSGILINKHKQITVIDYKKDDQGRIISIKAEFQQQRFQILNLYAPVRPHLREAFFQLLSSYIFEDCPLIMGGDFNMVEDERLDRDGGTYSHTHTQGILNLRKLLDSFDLKDRWRTHNKHTREFTWKSRKINEKIKSRLDRFYVTDSVKYIDSDTLYTVWSDHYVITLKIKMGITISRGVNYWKLNTTILDEEKYLMSIKNLVENHRLKHPQYHDITTWWEELKMEIKFFTKDYCSRRLKEKLQNIARIKKQIKNESNKTPINLTLVKLLHQDLEISQNEIDNGVIVRSREKMLLNEEKPTRFFYQQEQTRQMKKQITKLYNPEIHQTTTDTATIQKTLHNYYEQLYEKRDTDITLQNDLLQHIDLTLDDDDREALEKPITRSELLSTIQDTEGNKSPGIDGLPIEFYKTFWPIIQNEFLEMTNKIYLENLDFAPTQKRGVISLLYKSGNKEFLDNWRPITLLCADYKIISKTIAARLRKYMGKLVHENQTCAVPGRDILSNLYLIKDVVTHTQRKDQDAFIVSYDFQKAFDSIDHEYLLKTLQGMNFGPNYINFFRNTFTNRSAMVMNNGRFTIPFQIERGLIQGDPISLPTYCLVAEPFANKIRKNKHIIGISIPGKTERLKLSQYADDTESLSANVSSVQETLREFENFEKATGCALNGEKTKGLMILGSNSKKREEEIEALLPEISWEDGIKVLGIYFFRDDLNMQNFNWTQRIEKLKKDTKKLQSRQLSLKGKVTLLNSNILSQIWYLASFIAMPEWALKKLEKIIFKFLWGEGNPEPIKRATIYLPLEKGGLGLLHPKYQGEALLLKSFFKIVNPELNEPWIFYARYWLARRLVKYNTTSWNFLDRNDSPKYNGTDPPWHYKRLLNLFEKNREELLKLRQKTTKLIRISILKKVYQNYHITITQVWNEIFQQTIPWQKLWRHNYASYATGTAHDILFKIMHNCHPTRARIFKHMRDKRNLTDKCKYCKKAETTLHLFARCKIAQKIWKTYQQTYLQLTGQARFNYEQTVLTLHLVGTDINDKQRKLTLTLTTIILQEIWNSRTKFEKENLLPNIERSIKTINSKLGFIISTHFTHSMRHKDIEGFKTKFAINNALCAVSQEELRYHLPEYTP